MIQFPVIIFEFVVGNVENYLYFQIGIFNVKIYMENSVIYPFFLNFPVLIWIKHRGLKLESSMDKVIDI